MLWSVDDALWIVKPLCSKLRLSILARLDTAGLRLIETCYGPVNCGALCGD